MKKTKRQNNKPKFILFGLLLFTLAICAGVGINIKINQDEIHVEAPNVGSGTEETNTIEYADDQIPANIEIGQGEVIETTEYDNQEIKTVEFVDNNTPVVNEETEECTEGEECGRGAYYPSIDISTPQAFLSQTLGGCYDIDGHYNEQCWDYGALFFLNYTGRTLYTCGSGSAKGTIADGCWQKNAGSEFTMIWDARELQAGDWVVFNNGTFGHIGMAMGTYNNGYITLAGQNQGGGLCEGSTLGGRVNLINISLKYFAGAFRPNIYIKPEPEPEPTPSTTITYTYVKGDYFSKVLKKLGLDEGKLWGKDGTVVYYTQQLINQNMLDFRGNVKIGIPFTLTRR